MQHERQEAARLGPVWLLLHLRKKKSRCLGGSERGESRRGADMPRVRQLCRPKNAAAATWLIERGTQRCKSCESLRIVAL